MLTRARGIVVTVLVASALGWVVAVGLTVFWARSWGIVTVTILVAVTWAAAVAVTEAVVARAVPALPSDLFWQEKSVTYVVRVTEEQPDVARTSVVLAARRGPVAIVTTRHCAWLDELEAVGGVEIHEHVAPTAAAALQDALFGVTTDVVLVLSARAFPLADACEHAAAQIAGRVGWVTATAPTFNGDRFAPGERERLSARVRAGARTFGLVIWEPDATLVRTSLLRAHACVGGRPDGNWLRARAAEGWCGVDVADPVVARAAPTDAPAFWPTDTRRRAGAAADLADAVAHGPRPQRLLAAGLLLRELYAYPMALWLIAGVSIGRAGTLALSVRPVVFLAMLATLALLHWTAIRVAFGIGLHPIDGAREVADGLAGSFLALPAAFARRVPAVQCPLPDQPLLWLSMALTLLTSVALLDRRTAAGSAVGFAVCLVVASLAAAWTFALRAFGARGWDRATYRIAIDVPATIDGRPARTVNASSNGLALVSASPAVPRGARVVVAVAFAPTRTTTVTGRVTYVHGPRRERAVGVALDLDSRERVEWDRALFDALGLTVHARTVPDRPPAPRHAQFDRDPVPRRRISAMLEATLVIAVSALAIGALLLLFLGYEPMVVRSASMSPTLRVGDLVVCEWVPVDRMHPGDIVAFGDGVQGRELVTHRVQRLTVAGAVVHVVTKGDANTESEQWSLARGALVGRVVGRIPRVGTVVVALGGWSARALLLAASMTVLLWGAIVARRRSRSQPWEFLSGASGGSPPVPPEVPDSVVRT